MAPSVAVPRHGLLRSQPACSTEEVLEDKNYSATRGPKTDRQRRTAHHGDTSVVEVAQTISRSSLRSRWWSTSLMCQCHRVFDEVVDSVDVSVRQVLEEVVEGAQISSERIMKHIVFEVPAPQECSFLLPPKIVAAVNRVCVWLECVCVCVWWCGVCVWWCSMYTYIYIYLDLFSLCVV